MRLKPTVIVAIGVVFTSLSSILIRLSDAPPLAVASWRMVFTTILLAPLYLHERLRAPQATAAAGPAAGGSAAGPAAAASGTLRTAVALSAASGAFLALHFALWITSLSYTSVASSTVLVTTHPIIVAIAGFFLLGERVPLRKAVFLVTALAGSVVLVWGGLFEGESQVLGNLLAWLGAVAVSGYMLLGRVVRRRLSVNAYTMICYPVAALLLGIASALFRVPLSPYPIREFAIFIALALFCTLLGHSLFNWALEYVQTTVVSTSILGEPVIASLLALLLFGETPTITTLLGGAVILGSIYLFTTTAGTTRWRQ